MKTSNREFSYLECCAICSHSSVEGVSIKRNLEELSRALLNVASYSPTARGNRRDKLRYAAHLVRSQFYAML